MKYIVAKYSADYADEFDCEGFGVFSKKQWDKLCKDTEKVFESKGSIEVGFGTNEYLEFESYDDWFNTFDIYEVEEAEANLLIKLFGEAWGTGSGILDIKSYMIDTGEYDEEEDNE